MPSWEMQLISRLLRHGQITDALEWGVQEEDFLTDEGRQMFTHLLAYTMDPNNAGARLGPIAAKRVYPTFELCDDETSTLQQLCTEVRKTRLVVDNKAAAERVADMADEDPIKAAEQGIALLKDILQLGYASESDVRFTPALNRAIHRMHMMEEGIDLAKTHWPWPIIDEPTMGVQQDDYIVYYGRPKSMKSWVLSKHAAFTYDQGYRVMIYTKEMHPDNIFLRISACLAGLPYQDLRTGKLSDEARQRLYLLRDMQKEIQASDDMVCLSGSDAPGGNDTVPWLQSKVEKYKPDIVFIDGVYLMRNHRSRKTQKDNERVRDISRDLRQMVLDLRTPVVATIQANREAAKHQDANLDEVAFSDAVGQDATVVIRVINEKSTPTIALILGGSREFELHGLRIHAEPATNFNEIDAMTEKEISKAKEKDTSEEEGDKGKKKKAERKDGKSADAAATQRILKNKLKGI